MVIADSGLFHYRATIPAQGPADSEDIVLQGRTDGSRPGDSLAGRSPTIRFFEDYMILIAARGEPAPVRWCRFLVGDVINRAARAGDQIQLIRTMSGGIAVSLARGSRLIAAAGALPNKAIDLPIDLRLLGPGSGAASRVHAAAASGERTLSPREAAVVGGYDVYFEAPGETAIDARMEPVLSIAASDDQVVVNSARRSAVLISAGSFDPLMGELPDGTFIKRPGTA